MLRADAAENRTRLLDATGGLLADLGQVSLIDLARVTGLGRATVYRHFSSTEEVVEAYVRRELGDFLATGAEPIDAGAGVQRLRLLCERWIELVDRSAAALVHVRSTDGFLRRAADGDPIIAPIHEIMRAAFEACAADGRLSVDDPSVAVFYWNLLLDPRDVVDLARHRDVDTTTAGRALIEELFRLLGIDQ